MQLVARSREVRQSEAAPFRACAVGRVMLRRWISLSPQASLYEAERLMRLARLRQVPVVSDGILVGIVTYRDLLRLTIERLRGRRARRRLVTVAEVMVGAPETIAPTASLAQAAERMAAAQLGCLPVVESSPTGPALVGVVTEADLLRVAYDPLFAADWA